MTTDWPDGGAGRMLGLIRDLPQQLAASADHAGLGDLKPLAERPRRIVLCGMGGSAIAGDLLQPVLAAAGLGITVQRDYHLPPDVDRDTLLIASSYSGNTEETLSCVNQALDLNCRIVAMTSGGRLLATAGGERPFPAVLLPPGLPPRASLGLGLGTLLRIFGGLGLVENVQAEIDSTVDRLEAGNEAFLAALGNPDESTETPYGLAASLVGKFAVIYTTSSEAHAAGARFKAQLNENGKSPAYNIPFPELDHNDIVGWRLTPGQKKDFALLILRGGDEDERTDLRVAVTAELLAEEFGAVHQIRAAGDGTLARIMSLVQYGDYVSCYLAMHKGIDPVPVERIESLKQRLQEGAK